MNHYLLKCDISGIQKFIFNVPSEGAAQSLKSRSMFVQTVADDCLSQLKAYFGVSNTAELYNGGGNFYLKIITDKSETEIIKFITDQIYQPKIRGDLFVYVAFIQDKGEDIGTLLDAVNLQINKVKLQRPISLELLPSTPVDIKDVDLKELRKSKSINGQVPDGDFEWIAKHSEGDCKLAALKLDVDNLGSLFKGRSEADYKSLSDSLTYFFDGKLLGLIKDEKNCMQHNIYVVFSGGDDCFMIGSWNKIFEIAIQLRQQFTTFQEGLKAKIASLPKHDITFSAGLIVFQPHYPMLQLSREVEEALDTSKHSDGKNSITVFGKTLSWAEFERSFKVAKTLAELVNSPDEKSKESKSLLQIFRLVEPQGKELPKVWRLKYYLSRNVKSLNKDTVKEIFDEYAQALLRKYIKVVNRENPDIYLVASRWAELLLR